MANQIVGGERLRNETLSPFMYGIAYLDYLFVLIFNYY